jgi:hypothetical protein
VYEVTTYTESRDGCGNPASEVTEDTDYLAIYTVTLAGLLYRPALGLCADPASCAALEGIAELHRMHTLNNEGWYEGWSSWNETPDGTCNATAVRAELFVPEDGEIRYVRRRYELLDGPLPCSGSNPDIDLYGEEFCVEQDIVEAVRIGDLD